MKRIVGTLAAFALAFSLSAQEKPYTVYLVSAARFDKQWNWDVRESIDDCLHRTMVRNFYLFEKFPDYVFNFESAQKYSWMKEYYPQEFEKVREYVKAGSWNVCGSTCENRIYKVTLSENGDIASIIDKRYGKQMVDPDRPYRLMVLTDHTSNDYPAWEIYKTAVDGPSSLVDGNVRISVAFTADEFNRAGNFDRRGNSFAAELMPEVVKSDGISFKVCNDPTINDFVRADGQTVTLPEHKGTNKLFLSSIDGSRRATFNVDGKNFDVRVPYYSDFFGQWSWKGECEGYLKDGSFGCIANHKHSERKGNDSYNFAYLYKVCLDIPEDARTLTLPKDVGIAVFAATLADDPNHDTIDVSPMRIIPAQTVPVEYTTRPVPFFRERSLW